MLEQCCRILKPGGRLVVVTPNSQALGRYLLGKAWYLGWSPPWHLSLFDLKSLVQRAESAGLTVRRTWTTPRGARLAWITNRLLPSCGTLPYVTRKRVTRLLHVQGVLFWALEWLLLAVRPSGEEIVLIATKTGQSVRS